ncbi:stressosome-associated protein Prli42 [Paenibacillus montanisoli]|nr:stressosome-associated protein Prli42 [Paenibacillus montanisoli]
MRPNRIMKVFIWVLIASLLLSTLLMGIGWIFQ